MSYLIVKLVKTSDVIRPLPVILLDNTSEILEFETKEEADEVCTRFQVNSHSGCIYQVKEIGK